MACRCVSRSWVSHACRALPCVAAAIALAGCAGTGDFGRPVKPLFGELSDKFIPADASPATASSFAYTADEQEMRDVAYRLRTAPRRQMALFRAPNAERRFAVHQVSAGKYPYGPSRVVAIEDELLADCQAVDRFGTVASRVVADDRARAKALRVHPADYDGQDRADAGGRIRDNRVFIAHTLDDTSRRYDAYGFALSRARIESPDAWPLPAEESLKSCRLKLARLRAGLLGGDGLFGGDVRPAAATYKRSLKDGPPPGAPIDVRPPGSKGF